MPGGIRAETYGGHVRTKPGAPQATPHALAADDLTREGDEGGWSTATAAAGHLKPNPHRVQGVSQADARRPDDAGGRHVREEVGRHRAQARWNPRAAAPRRTQDMTWKGAITQSWI